MSFHIIEVENELKTCKIKPVFISTITDDYFITAPNINIFNGQS